VTKTTIESLLRDVTGELELLNRLRRELNHHPLRQVPQRYYSPATLDKAYFSEMGINPPQEKFNIPNEINGIAMQAFFAGRAESSIRRTVLPVTYLDFHAQFPAVSNLLTVRKPSGHGLGFLQAPTRLQLGSEEKGRNGRKTCRRGSSKRGILCLRESWGFRISHDPGWITQR
jgi:hypothetical protein